jgi:hypothetical protein
MIFSTTGSFWAIAVSVPAIVIMPADKMIDVNIRFILMMFYDERGICHQTDSSFIN